MPTWKNPCKRTANAEGEHVRVISFLSFLFFLFELEVHLECVFVFEDLVVVLGNAVILFHKVL